MILHGDCIEEMAKLDEACIDAIVCDPPYGLEFMGKEWDKLKSGRSEKYENHAGLSGTGSGTGRSQDKGDYSWFGSAAKRPTYFQRAAKRCKKCGKQAWSGSPCQCEQPEWELDNSPLHAAQEWHQAWATQALRVLKPGGHLLAFGGTRTYHRLACAIEDAGFEIRDSLIWIYGSGFPKSLDVSKAIDKAGGDALAWRAFSTAYASAVEASGLSHADIDRVLGIKSSSCYWARTDHRGGMPPFHHWENVCQLLNLSSDFKQLYDEAEREKVGSATGAQAASTGRYGGWGNDEDGDGISTYDLTTPATPEAAQWEGWGTALKPAHEPIVLARKPLTGTVAANVLEHGTGALNVDGCRVGSDGGGGNGLGSHFDRLGDTEPHVEHGEDQSGQLGRWPANLVLSHLPECAEGGPKQTPDGTTYATQASYCAPGCPVAELDAQSGELASPATYTRGAHAEGEWLHAKPEGSEQLGYGDTGGASRFFYTAKASRGERNAGLDGFDRSDERNYSGGPLNRPDHASSDGARRTGAREPRQNVHPTVKPIDLMRWLCRLVTPPNGTVLDPFVGSGTTGIAAHLGGFDFIGIEREAEYVAIAKARIEWWAQFPAGTTTEAALGIESVERKVKESGQGSLLEQLTEEAT